jgi:hypothetical protein
VVRRENGAMKPGAARDEKIERYKRQKVRSQRP